MEKFFNVMPLSMEKKNKSRIKICYAMEYILHQKLNPCTYNLNFKNEVLL